MQLDNSIVKALNQAKLEANVRARSGDNNLKKKLPSPYAIGSGALLLVSFAKFWYSPLQWLALGAVAVGIVPIILRSFAAVKNFTLDINILMLIAGKTSLTTSSFA
ncbi:hypothetical protein LIER_41604 [Lithospermum erythrorhizon]|uniref:Uncharacterized protein n=1 Tax=Lithospermum erythrorhizon TaxID=34254 RepID=A0AAV3RDF9_LITER